jgi:TetR/AcrR family transcriptional regulator
MRQHKVKKELKGGKEGRASRQALMDAGQDAFAELGFDGATVDEIARRARVNKAMISYHFGGKAGLYEAILRRTFTAAIDRLEALQDSPEPADVLLRRFVQGFGDIVGRNPTWPTMMLREVLSGGAHLNREMLPNFLNVFSLVREIVNRGMREGVFRPVNPFLTHLSLIGGLLFYFATAPMRERLAAEGMLPMKMPERKEYVRHMEELAVRALAADAPAAGPSRPGGAPSGSPRSDTALKSTTDSPAKGRS